MKRLRLLGGVLLALSLSISLVATTFAQEQTVTVQIDPVGGSGVSGTATLTAMDGATQVTLNVSGFEPNTSHATHIHVGQCPSPGGIVFDLPTLVADANGVATATGMVNASLASLMDGNHVVQTHVAGPPNFGPGVACGDIPMAEAAVEPAEEEVEVAEVPAAPVEEEVEVVEAPVEPVVEEVEVVEAPVEPVVEEAVEVAVAPVAPAPVVAAPAVAGGPAPLAAAAVLGMLGLFSIGGAALLRRR